MNVPATLFAAVLATAVGAQGWLALRQIRHVRRHAAAKVDDPGDDKDEIRAAADQAVAGALLKTAVAGAQAVLAWTLLVGGGLGWLRTVLPLGTIAAGAFIVAAIAVSFLLVRIAADAYRRFTVDRRHGLNRMTARCFAMDAGRTIVATLAIAAGAGAAVTWLIQLDPPRWWLWTAGFVIAALALQAWLRPLVIAPLFERSQSLAEGPLRERLGVLMRRHGFDHATIVVTDESRRSSRANARASGMARACRVALSDTLIELLSTDEVEAVAAHEIGHLRRYHGAKDLALKILVVIAGLAVFSRMLEHPAIAGALRLSQGDAASGAAALMVFVPIAEQLLTPLASGWYRHLEHEADAFAASCVRPGYLMTALRKLGRANASTLPSDPLYAAFHGRHPELQTRWRRLMQKSDLQHS